MKNAVNQKADQCAQLIEEAQRIAVLTGAGISTAAGIPDFRGPQGLYVTKRYDPDTVFDFGFFLKNPEPFYDFAREFMGLEQKIKPTFTHYFLAELEKMGKLKGIITQNIDALHHKAGSKNILEMHGSFWKSFCLDCGKEFSYEHMRKWIYETDVLHCDCGGLVKPDVVFFGENVKYLSEAYQLAEEADLFFVIGTSCVVQPVASVPSATRGKIVIVNKDRVHLPGNVVLEVQDDIDGFFQEVSKQLDKTQIENREQRTEVRKN